VTSALQKFNDWHLSPDWIFAEFYAVNRRNGFSDALHPALAGSYFAFRLSSFGLEPGRSASGVLHFLGWKLLFAEANRIILSNSAQVKGATRGLDCRCGEGCLR
jgi:hypothetical protein